MSEMKELIIDSSTKIFEKYSTKEAVNAAEEGNWAAQLWEQLTEYGMMSVAIPEDLGGNGGDYEDAFSIIRLAGKFAAPIPIAETYAVNWMLASLGEQMEDGVLTVSYDKEDAPFHLREQGDKWLVSGKAQLVPWARHADKLLIFAKSEGNDVLAVVPLSGASITECTNLAGEPRDTVIFDAVEVACSPIAINMEEQRNNLYYTGTVARCLMMAGALERVLELTVNHTKERTQFGRPLHRFQAVGQQIAQLAGESAAANAAANGALNAFSKGELSVDIAYGKIRLNEAAGAANKMAHQILAAIGFTHEHTLHHSTRRLWSWRDECGTETDWAKVVTSELINLEKDGLWSMISGVNTMKKVEL